MKAKIFRITVLILWLASTCLFGYIAWDAAQSVLSPKAMWGEIILDFFAFLGMTLLAYNFIFGSRFTKDE